MGAVKSDHLANRLSSALHIQENQTQLGLWLGQYGQNGIFTRVIMSGHTALQPMMEKVKFRVDPEGCPNAERVMRHGLMLPCHPTMTLEDCRYLYQTIDDFIALQRGK